MKQKTSHPTDKLDGLAIILSGACLIHCLALPIVLTMFPIFQVQGSFLEESTFHLLILLLILPTSIVALAIGCRRHKDRLTVILGAIGLGVLSVTALVGHDWFGHDGERYVTSLGGLILAAAHIRNYRCCRRAHCDHDHNE